MAIGSSTTRCCVSLAASGFEANALTDQADRPQAERVRRPRTPGGITVCDDRVRSRRFAYQLTRLCAGRLATARDISMKPIHPRTSRASPAPTWRGRLCEADLGTDLGEEASTRARIAHAGSRSASDCREFDSMCDLRDVQIAMRKIGAAMVALFDRGGLRPPGSQNQSREMVRAATAHDAPARRRARTNERVGLRRLVTPT
jgi:hypothetical protein